MQFQIYSGQELTVRFEENLLLFFGLKGNSEIICGTESRPLAAAGPDCRQSQRNPLTFLL